MGIRPFYIHVEDQTLDDLQRRLARTRWPTITGENGWKFGTSSAYLRELMSYWRTGYDWRLQESKLNELPQFKANLDGGDLHFAHVKGRSMRALPLLLLHGWPDSFCRFAKVIPTFSDPERAGGTSKDAFDVVVPSLPGFAFSGRVQFPNQERPMRQTAEMLWQLMTQVLGYERFAIAGGDTGSAVAQNLAIAHPSSVVGIHVTDLSWHAGNVDPAMASKAEQKYLEASKKRFMEDGAYIMVQTTEPRGLTPGLNDSPVGLASWILDRFHSWSDGGDHLRTFTPDELLTNIMLYWVTQTIDSSVHHYYAEARSPSLLPSSHVDVPCAVALFPHDAAGIPPRSLGERTLNVQRWAEMPRGGHFGPLEEPALYAHDVVEFFRPLRSTR